MNSGTLVGSLIFAGVVVVVITILIQLMMRGWRRKAEEQAELIGVMPVVPDIVGAAELITRGLYCGSTLAPEWHDRVTAGDLGYRSKAVLTRYTEGILLERIRAQPIWISQDAITAIRTERGIAGKVVARQGVLVIRWRLPSATEIDTGFRANNRDEYAEWLAGWPEGVAE